MFSVSTSNQLCTSPEHANNCLVYFELLVRLFMINKKSKCKNRLSFVLSLPFNYLSKLIINLHSATNFSLKYM